MLRGAPAVRAAVAGQLVERVKVAAERRVLRSKPEFLAVGVDILEDSVHVRVHRGGVLEFEIAPDHPKIIICQGKNTDFLLQNPKIYIKTHPQGKSIYGVASHLLIKQSS